MAAYDREPAAAALMAIDEINASGGIDGRQIRTIEKDVRSNPETVGIVTQELINEGAQLVVTPADFDLSAPGLAIAQSSAIPAVSIGAADPKISDLKTIGDYSFTANAGSDSEASVGAQWAFDQGWRNAYLLTDQSIEYTKSLGKYFQAKQDQLGGNLIGKDAFQGGDNVDVSAQISAIKRLPQQPDYIYLASWGTGAATAVKQIRNAGIDIPIVAAASLDGKTNLDIMGRANDVYITSFACYEYCTGADLSDLDSFVAAFQEKTGSPPSNSYALLGYNMILAFANALGGVDTASGSAVKSALEDAGPVSTPIGELQYFSPDCHRIIDFPLTIERVGDGAMTFVEQMNASGIPDIGDGNPCVG